MDDVITLDSDDESNIGAQMPYNPSDYADLVPAAPQVQAPLPVPVRSMLSAPRGRAAGMGRGRGGFNNAIPKKPGAMPPFALFSQERRQKLQDDNPEIGFGEIGKRLGEMWHALSEEDKEQYRRRAKDIADEKLRRWREQIKQLPKPQPMSSGLPARAMMQPRQSGPARLLQGYSVFSAELRRKYSSQGMQPAEISQRISNEWRNSSAQVRHMYEMRATKLNSQQANQRRAPRPILPAPGPNARYTQQAMFRGQVPQRQLPNLHQQGVRRSRPGPPPGINLPPSIQISSVTSLSPIRKKNVNPPINLPSSISISRVEPEISIVAEQLPTPRRIAAPPPLAAQRQMIRPQFPLGRGIPPLQRGRGGMIRGGRMMAQAGRGMMRMSNPRMASPMGMGYPGARPAIGNGQMLKRSHGTPMHGAPMAKRPRAEAPVLSSPHSSTLGAPVNTAGLDSFSKICRICGQSSTHLYLLSDRSDLASKFNELLGLDIDITKNEERGYPPSACRRCCNVTLNFQQFKKSVTDGQKIVESLAEQRRTEMQQQKTVIVREDNAEESILPDLDLDIEDNPPMVAGATSQHKPVDIKQEVIAGLSDVVDEKPREVKPEPKEDAKEELKEGGEEEGEKDKNAEVAEEKSEGKTEDKKEEENEDGKKDGGKESEDNEKSAKDEDVQADSQDDRSNNSADFVQNAYSIDVDAFNHDDEFNGEDIDPLMEMTPNSYEENSMDNNELSNGFGNDDASRDDTLDKEEEALNDEMEENGEHYYDDDGMDHGLDGDVTFEEDEDNDGAPKQVSENKSEKADDDELKETTEEESELHEEENKDKEVGEVESDHHDEPEKQSVTATDASSQSDDESSSTEDPSSTETEQTDDEKSKRGSIDQDTLMQPPSSKQSKPRENRTSSDERRLDQAIASITDSGDSIYDNIFVSPDNSIRGSVDALPSSVEGYDSAESPHMTKDKLDEGTKESAVEEESAILDSPFADPNEPSATEDVSAQSEKPSVSAEESSLGERKESYVEKELWEVGATSLESADSPTKETTEA